MFVCCGNRLYLCNRKLIIQKYIFSRLHGFVEQDFDNIIKCFPAVQRVLQFPGWVNKEYQVNRFSQTRRGIFRRPDGTIRRPLQSPLDNPPMVFEIGDDPKALDEAVESWIFCDNNYDSTPTVIRIEFIDLGGNRETENGFELGDLEAMWRVLRRDSSGMGIECLQSAVA